MNKPACQTGGQEAKQRGRSVYMQAARPATKKRDNKRASKATSQRASQHASQAARPPANKPAHQAASQPARHKRKRTKQKDREAHRDSNSHNQAGALMAQLHGGNPPLPQRDSIDKPLGSQCNPCLTETKHDVKQ